MCVCGDGRGDWGVKRRSICGERNGAEEAHRIDDQVPAPLGDGVGDLRQRIENAGRGLAVDKPDMGDRRFGVGLPGYIGGGGGDVVGGERGDLAGLHIVGLQGVAR